MMRSLAGKPPAECAIDRAEVLRYLGYRGQALSDGLLERMEAVIERCEASLRPSGMFEVFAVESVDADGAGSVELSDTTLSFSGQDIVRHLQGAKAVAVMAVTLGARSEQELQRLSALDPLEAVVYDAACSALVESAADAWEDRVVEEALCRGLVTNWRYSPGYGDFPLAAQPDIVRTLRADVKLGLTVLDSCLLLPTKSVTAVVGLFEEEPRIERGTNPCARCTMRETCAMRKNGVVCHGRVRHEHA